MDRVLIESRFAGSHGAKCRCDTCTLEVERNITYARAAMHDCFLRHEAPFASHLLYTQPGVLDDTIPEERTLGIEAGLLYGDLCTISAFYMDFGIGPGMSYGLERARQAQRKVELRSLPSWAQFQIGQPTPSFQPSKTLMQVHFVDTPLMDVCFKHGLDTRPALLALTGEPAPSGMLTDLVLRAMAERQRFGSEWTVVTMGTTEGPHEMRIMSCPPDWVEVSE